jgi:hypothetical protein
MLRRSERIRFGWLAGLSLGTSALVCTGGASAQAPAETAAPPPEAPPAEAPPPAAEPAPEPAQPETAQAPTQSATPVPEPTAPVGVPPAEPPPSLIPDGEAPKGPIAPAFPPAIPNVDYGARLRAVIKLQNPEDPEKVNDVSEQVEADLYVNGQIHRFLKYQVALTLAYPGTSAAPQQVNVSPLDVIARIEPLPEFNVYLGRMLVVVDRFAPSGPWGIDEFFFPGFFPLIGPPALPKAGAQGRDVGATVWGAPLKGLLKYYLGAFNLYDPSLNPLLSGRVQVSLLNGEPAFYHRGTYFGTKDIISAGVGGQYQKDGSVQAVPPAMAGMPPTVPLTDDYSMLTADLTVEKNIGDAGTLSAVGAFSKFNGDYQRWENYWLASLGYMLPQPIGIGKPRITVRYQRAQDAADGADPSSVLDAQLSYNIAAWFARFALGYRRGESWLPPSMTAPATVASSNMLYFGVTLADP